MYNRNIKAYQASSLEAELACADPHKVIQILMRGFLERLAKAKGAIERKNLEEKSKHLASCIAILSSLRISLNFEEGGDISENLNSLYDYMTGRLVDAGKFISIEPIDEVAQLMITLKEGWERIPDSAKQDAFCKQMIKSNNEA